MEQQVQSLSFIRVFWDQQPKWTVKGALITLPKNFQGIKKHLHGKG